MRKGRARIGDLVERIRAGGGLQAGYQFKIVTIVTEGPKEGFLVDEKGSTHNPAYVKLVTPAPEFQPQPGEIIKVGNEQDNIVSEREFVCMDGDRYVCKTGENQYFGYAFAKKYTRTVTLEDGTQVEVSPQTYKILEADAKAQKG